MTALQGNNADSAPSTFWRVMTQPVQIRDGHDNFFTPLRLLMAILVMVGHASVIANRDINAEPSIFFHYGFSYLAVNLFFIASGFLVTKSMAYRGDIPDYSSARLLRIYPALIVHLLFVMFIIGPLASTTPLWEYLTHPDVWKQPLLVLSFINTDVVLPEAFLSNHEQFASVPLWTLRYELLAYIGTAFVFSIGFMRRKWMILAQFILPCMAWILTKEFGIYEHLPATAQNALRFGIVYGLGAAIYAYKDRLTFNILGLAVVISAALIFGKTYLSEITTNLLLGYSLMLLAYVKAPRFKRLQTLSDVSYGVYIYHWCILQLAFYWWPSLNAWTLLLVAAPVTFLLSHASWHFVEKPILKAKSSFARHLRFGRTPKRFDTSQLLLD